MRTINMDDVVSNVCEAIDELRSTDYPCPFDEAAVEYAILRADIDEQVLMDYNTSDDIDLAVVMDV